MPFEPLVFGRVDEPPALELGAEPTRDHAALDDGRRRPGVEVEHDQVDRAVGAVGDRAPLGHVQLQRGEVGDPDRVARSSTTSCSMNSGPLDLSARGTRTQCAHVGRLAGGVLLEKRLAVDPVGVAGHGQRASLQVWQEDRGDVQVVPDDIGLGEAGLRVEHLVEVRHGEAACRPPR